MKINKLFNPILKSTFIIGIFLLSGVFAVIAQSGNGSSAASNEAATASQFYETPPQTDEEKIAVFQRLIEYYQDNDNQKAVEYCQLRIAELEE